MNAYFEGAEEFVFLDFETTGRDLIGRDYFSPEVPKHDATQIAIGWFDGVQLKSAYSYIRPNQDYFKLKHWSHVSPDRKLCENAPTYKDLYPIIAGIIAGKKIVAHNAPFDKKVMDDTMVYSGLVPSTNQWIDSAELSRQYLPNPGTCYDDCRNGCKGHTLIHLHHYFGFGKFNAHDAVADVHALIRVFSVMYKPKTDYSKDWVFV
jgi:DNA polymerase III epsilon subunit-like protein